MGLTVKRIERASKPGRYGDGGNLFLQVSPSGTKSWLFRYTINGKERWMGLGPYPTFSLPEARERARRAKQMLVDGIDPLEQRAAERAMRDLAAAKTKTFQYCAEAYYQAHEASWSNAKHRQQFRHTMRDYVYPKIGSLSVAAIDVGQVLRCIEPHWHAKASTMNRTRGRIESVLDWASVRGYRTGDNPARWKGHLSEVLAAPGKIAKTEHHPALGYNELPEFMTKVAQQQGVAARALEFLILTATSSSETVNAVWSEFDLANKVWVVPAQRMKAGKEHRVPLSDRAIEILQALPREGEFVFIGSRPGAPISDLGMYRVLRRLRPDMSVHGFRATFRTWADEQTSYPHHVVEQALAHSVGSAVERAYRRGDIFKKRVLLMDAWAQYATTPMKSGTVVPLVKRAEA
jgi:integrase